MTNLMIQLDRLSAAIIDDINIDELRASIKNYDTPRDYIDMLLDSDLDIPSFTYPDFDALLDAITSNPDYSEMMLHYAIANRIISRLA
jgi:hypothetical protein